MPRDGGGISRMGNKHKKPSKFDIHRKLKQPKQPEAAEEGSDGGSERLDAGWRFEWSVARCAAEYQDAKFR